MATQNSSALSIESQRLLLKIARKAIESHLQSRTSPASRVADVALFEKRGAFVSLHKAGKLRGCIGYLTSEHPLYQTVPEAAVAVATRDPRFEPVEIEEMAEIEIEISVLTPLERIESVNEIEISVHGLHITFGKQAGLLLPQVATEHNLNHVQFLELTCRKAGLPTDAWHDPEMAMYVFGAQVFVE